MLNLRIIAVRLLWIWAIRSPILKSAVSGRIQDAGRYLLVWIDVLVIGNPLIGTENLSISFSMICTRKMWLPQKSWRRSVVKEKARRTGKPGGAIYTGRWDKSVVEP
ncbi:hypothetical protein I7I48_07616 [Histoplasma ohiense]|nr:hypothetical protein I7I48_07616 [Histoplasma ohiense (nom. inval.)]